MRIGVAGLSVGHVIAYTLAAQGMCGDLRLADFDRIELSNLNRVPATVLDLGLNKAEVAARRIAELDPYLQVQVLDMGLTLDTVDEFLDGLDIVVEECDSLHIKAIVRQRARARRIPVLMATSDRGLVDVERFDLEPKRPIAAQQGGLIIQPLSPVFFYACCAEELAELSRSFANELGDLQQEFRRLERIPVEAYPALVLRFGCRRLGFGAEPPQFWARLFAVGPAPATVWE